jgi:hypothetical protein
VIDSIFAYDADVLRSQRDASLGMIKDVPYILALKSTLLYVLLYIPPWALSDHLSVTTTVSALAIRRTKTLKNLDRDYEGNLEIFQYVSERLYDKANPFTGMGPST